MMKRDIGKRNSGKKEIVLISVSKHSEKVWNGHRLSLSV
jgi:hypothetical protein